MSALEFLARWVDHVPERYEGRVRYAGAYATRRRVWWRRCGAVLVKAPGAETVSPVSMTSDSWNYRGPVCPRPRPRSNEHMSSVPTSVPGLPWLRLVQGNHSAAARRLVFRGLRRGGTNRNEAKRA